MDSEQASAGQRPQFARAGDDTTELRGLVPTNVINVLDAVSFARDKRDRMQLVNEILREWAERVTHEATLVNRVVQRNPAAPETTGDRR